MSREFNKLQKLASNITGWDPWDSGAACDYYYDSCPTEGDKKAQIFDYATNALELSLTEQEIEEVYAYIEMEYGDENSKIHAFMDLGSSEKMKQLPRSCYYQYFQTKERNVDDRSSFFTCLTDDAPEDLSDFIHKIHDDYFDACLPNDWVYAVISNAFEEIHHDKIDDIMIEADPYYYDLVKWLHNGFADGYCNKALSEGLNEGTDVHDIIGWGQFMAKECIYQAVNEFIEEERE